MTDLIKRPPALAVTRLDELTPTPRPPAEEVGERTERDPLWHYGRIFLRRRWLVLSVLLAALVLGIIQILTTTPLYLASATLQVDPEAPKMVTYDPVAPMALSAKAGENLLWTQATKLKARTLSGRVAEKLQLADNESFGSQIREGLLLDAPRSVMARLRGRRNSTAPDPVARLLWRLDVEPLRDTRLIEVRYLSPDPELAALVVNSLLDESIEQHLEDRYNTTLKASDFLRRKLTDMREEVEASEQRLVDYARENDIVNLSERQTIAVQTLESLNRQLAGLEGDFTRDSAIFAEVGLADGELPNSLVTETIRQLEQRMSELSRERARLAGEYGENWPEVKRIVSEIDEVELQLQAERRQAFGAAREDFRIAVGRRSQLRSVVEKQRGIVDRLSESSVRYNLLKREAESNKQLYEDLLQRLKEASLAQGLRSSNLHVSDRAVTPRSQAYPDRLMVLALSLVLGLIGGLGSALVVEALDNKVKDPDDVAERLGLPVLGAIPSGRDLLPEPAAEPAEGVLAMAPLVLAYASRDPLEMTLQEAFRELRNAILLSHSDRPPVIIQVLSALPREGKTMTVANIGLKLAQTGARTLMVDLDLRNQSLAQAFGMARDGGMVNFLSGNSDLASQLTPTGFPNLYLIGAGPRTPNPNELIGSRRMRASLDVFRAHFDHVVIDSPPLMATDDGLIIAPYVDGVLLVARSGQTPREALAKSAERLRRVGAKLLGVVVTEADGGRDLYGYGQYGYGEHQEPASAA